MSLFLKVEHQNINPGRMVLTRGSQSLLSHKKIAAFCDDSWILLVPRISWSFAVGCIHRALFFTELPDSCSCSLLDFFVWLTTHAPAVICALILFFR